MSAITPQQRYDDFQTVAVNNIFKDFQKKLNGRYLLVIPTGGGKTFTAVKAVNRLFENGVLNPAKDRILWTAHRVELLQQARETFEKFAAFYPDLGCYADNVDFKMIGEANDYLAAITAVRLIVVDEAHHCAAPTYLPLFDNDSVGILGLTATPSRHDGVPLKFDRESYSIGFPDLVKKGIVLKPEVRRVEGGKYVITDFDDTSLELLNNVERNQKIITELLKHPDQYKKVIIYVGTKAHVQSLYELLSSSPVKDKYESISYITGEQNSRDQDRQAFIDQEKTFKRAILVNVMVLSEGYDDPGINTVVMATPCKSKLYYMQAMGRAIRHCAAEPLKRAFCVEVVDELPNIRYRIDNRWLYSDVSDALEPAVIDSSFSSADQFKQCLTLIYDQYGVPEEHRQYPVFDVDQRYSLLLFQRYLAPGNYAHFPILINNDNRLRVSNLFNYVSERLEEIKDPARAKVAEDMFKAVGADAFTILPTEKERRWVYQAMKTAIPGMDPAKKVAYEIEAKLPWLVFAALHYQQLEIPLELLEFVQDMVNKDDILEQITSRSFESGASLIRLPLPLKSFIGKIVSPSEFAAIDALITKLRELRDTKGMQDHRNDLHSLLYGSIIPIELAHKDSLVLIARTDDSYHLKLQ
jgi:superfamily II DNA or RNA helicase